MFPFLTLQHATVVRGQTNVLHDLSLRIAQGERIAILGPNGCGKSTLIKLISREIYPLASPKTKVEILGRERWDISELKRTLGIVQNDLPGPSILKCTATEAILTGFFSTAALWPHLQVTPEMHDQAYLMLTKVGARDFADRPFGLLSAGQQRRILIGRALVASRNCLLLDEPSNALDLAAQRDLRNLLTDLASQGTTLIHITHHIADLIPAISRIIFLSRGRIIADGPRAELLTAPNLSQLFQTEVRLAEHEGLYHAW